MNSGDCLSNCPRGRGKNNKQHRKLSVSTAKKSGNCIYFWCLVPQINPGALEKTWYVFNIPIIYNTQRCIVAAARVSLFHPQTKTNYEDEFPEDELPRRRRIPFRRRIPKTNSPKTNSPKTNSEDEFPRIRITSRRRILKTNSPKTKIAPRRRIPCRRRMAPEDEFFPEDQTRQRNVAFEMLDGVVQAAFLMFRQAHGKIWQAQCVVRRHEVRQALQCAHYTVH